MKSDNWKVWRYLKAVLLKVKVSNFTKCEGVNSCDCVAQFFTNSMAIKMIDLNTALELFEFAISASALNKKKFCFLFSAKTLIANSNNSSCI